MFAAAAAAEEDEEEGPAPHNFSLKLVVVVVVVVGEAIFAVVYAASESLLRSFSAVCGGTDIFSLGEWGEERGDEGMRVEVVVEVLVVEVGGCSKFLRMVRAGTVKASRGVEAKSREVTSGLVAVVGGVVTSS